MPLQRSYAPASKQGEGLASQPGRLPERIRMTAVASPWLYRLRVLILLITIGLTATAIAMGFVAVNKSIQQKNTIVSHFLVVYSVRVTVHNGNIYVPNMITTVGSIGLLGSAVYALGTSCYNHRSSHFTTREKLKIAFEAPLYLIVTFTIWMMISLIFESIWFHRGRVRITRNDGQSIPPWDVVNTLVELGIADRFRNVQYWRYALIFQWVAAAFGLVSSLLLLSAGIGIQTFTAVTPHDAETVDGGNNSQYHYTKRTSATNLDGPVVKRMSAREVDANPESEDQIVIEPRNSASSPPDAQYAPHSEGQDIAHQGPQATHTPLRPRSPLVGAHTSPQLSALQADAEGDIVEVPLDKVAPPVRVNDLDEGTHIFVQNDDTPPRA